MAKTTNKNDLEQIYQRLDHLTSFIEKSFDEIEDIGEIRSIVDDLRANLLKTIDERVEYILGKQRDIYEMRFSQIENEIGNITEANKEDLKELKLQLLSEIKNLRNDLSSKNLVTEKKIDNHLSDKINWKQIIVPAIAAGLISILLVIIVALTDSYFKLGFLDLLDKLKP